MHLVPGEHFFPVEFSLFQESFKAGPLRSNIQLLFHRFLDAGVGHDDDTFLHFNVTDAKESERFKKRVE